MSTDEQDRIIAAMVKERAELRRTIACIKQKLDWATTELVRAQQAIRFAHDGSIVGEESGLSYMSADELMRTLEQLRDATTRQKEINARLDLC